jgi:hypothetical protein
MASQSNDAHGLAIFSVVVVVVVVVAAKVVVEVEVAVGVDGRIRPEVGRFVVVVVVVVAAVFLLAGTGGSLRAGCTRPSRRSTLVFDLTNRSATEVVMWSVGAGPVSVDTETPTPRYVESRARMRISRSALSTCKGERGGGRGGGGARERRGTRTSRKF